MAEKRIWFKRKRYGWGWYPASWQGWAVVLVWVMFFAAGEVFFINYVQYAEASWIVIAGYFAYLAALMTALIAVCYRRGESPRWQWGKKDN